MKIVHLVPGSGGSFYCGNCMRDSVYVNALRDLGNDVIMLPLYLPLNENDYGNFGDNKVFFGAVSLYLKQQVSWLRNMPNWLEKLLDSPILLRLAAKKAGSTRASGLEEMTISMLKGEEGRQKQELKQLVTWLNTEEHKPDIIHLSNALLIGMAHQLKKELQVPIVCSLQDENVWLDVMDEPYRTTCWEMIEERSAHVDAFVSASHYFSAFIQTRIQLPVKKIFTVRAGIDINQYHQRTEVPNIPCIGFLSRLCESNGLELLIDAFILLKKNAKHSTLQLKLTGGKTGDDHDFLKRMHKKLAKYKLLNDVEFVHNFYGEARHTFLKQISVLSVPVLIGEALGLYQLEALASGIPLVQPNLGAFPEIIKATEGGWIYEPNTSEALADALNEALSNSDELFKRGQNGRRNLEHKFNSKMMAGDIVEVYETLI